MQQASTGLESIHKAVCIRHIVTSADTEVLPCHHQHRLTLKATIDEIVASANTVIKNEYEVSEIRFRILNDAFVSSEPHVFSGFNVKTPLCQESSIRQWDQVGPWILQFNEVRCSRSQPIVRTESP